MAINCIIYSTIKYNCTPLCICAVKMGPMNCKEYRTIENELVLLHTLEGLENIELEVSCRRPHLVYSTSNGENEQ